MLQNKSSQAPMPSGKPRAKTSTDDLGSSSGLNDDLASIASSLPSSNFYPNSSMATTPTTVSIKSINSHHQQKLYQSQPQKSSRRGNLTNNKPPLFSSFSSSSSSPPSPSGIIPWSKPTRLPKSKVTIDESRANKVELDESLDSMQIDAEKNASALV